MFLIPFKVWLHHSYENASRWLSLFCWASHTQRTWRPCSCPVSCPSTSSPNGEPAHPTGNMSPPLGCTLPCTSSCVNCLCVTCFSLCEFPKMLFYLAGNSRAISYSGCLSQLFFYHFLGCTECFLYTVMAYDRELPYVTPLRYTIIMNHRACAILAMGTSFWL